MAGQRRPAGPPLVQPSTRTGSKRNISAHHDLGNAFYKEWLDPSMTYSSGALCGWPQRS
ncbi:class I SAM-dependent methyltransferase [Mesorhizobium sp.]|uniref:class I SAM-dependent methyltransferase n=1 Tax=Mesorhizobium sp. TaxID=1871066 RepID=UPI00338D7D44